MLQRRIYRFISLLILCWINISIAFADTTEQVNNLPTEHRVTVNGHEFALWQRSVKQPKATILLLHGRTYSALPDFDLQVPGEDLSFMQGLNQLGYNVFALDARGYGKTSRDVSGWLTPDQAAKDAIAIINWIKQTTDGPLHLYGWSYGSMVSQIVAQRHPDLAASILLFGYPFDPKRHLVTQQEVSPQTPPARQNSRQHAASDFITPGSISTIAINTYVDSALRADPIRVDFKNLHEWAELDAKKITTPTLLMQAEFDPLARTEIQLAFFTHINSQQKWWVVLAGGDHAALLESPRDEMLAAMDAFMTSVINRY